MEQPHDRITMYQTCLIHSRADRNLRTVISTQLEQFRLTMMEWLLLGVVNESDKDGITLSKIAEILDVSQPQVTALMDKVSRQNLVKQKVLKEDRRSRSVILSIRGRRLLDKIEEDIGAHIQQWLAEVPPEQYNAYLDTVQFISMRRPTE